MRFSHLERSANMWEQKNGVCVRDFTVSWAASEGDVAPNEIHDSHDWSNGDSKEKVDEKVEVKMEKKVVEKVEE